MGVCLILLGAFTFLRPRSIFTGIAVVYGVAAVVTGVCDIVIYIKEQRFTGFGPGLSLVSGILSILTGVALLAYPGIAEWIVSLLFPLWFMAHCIGRLTHLGLETLHLRMQRHCENALALAKHLEASPYVEWVNYPGLESNKYYDLAQKYLPKGAGGVLTFGVKGGLAAGTKFIENLDMTSLVVHVGDLRTSVLHPSSTTHRQLSEADQIAAGIRPELIRVSVGIEDIQDILADFDQALEKACR